MSVAAYSDAGSRVVTLKLPARAMLHVWFHLHASLATDETTRASRSCVAALLPALQRALVASGQISELAARDLQRHMERKPQPPPLDTRVPFWQEES